MVRWLLLAVWAMKVVDALTSVLPAFASSTVLFSTATSNLRTKNRFHSHPTHLKMASGSSGSHEAVQYARDIFSYSEDDINATKFQIDFVLLRFLLKFDKRFSRSSPKVKRSLLAAVVETGRADLVSQLIKMGAPVNDQDIRGRNALMIACTSTESGDWDEIVEILMKAGSDVLARDCKGDTALHMAARAGKEGIVLKLRRASAELHHAYSLPHFKAFLWLSGDNMLSGISNQAPSATTSHAVALCKMNLDMVSINAALALDSFLVPARRLEDKA